MGMSLTLGLILAAAAALVAIAGHGWWTTRRSQPRQALPEPVPPSQRIDPTLGALSPASAADVAGPGAMPAALSAAFAKRPVRIDALIDAIASVSLEQPIAAETVIAHMPASRRVGSKPMLIEGLRSDDGAWESVTPGSRYSELQVAVQMANRSGAINEIEYSEFVQKVQALADALQGTPDFAEMRDVVSRARELDQFANQHDATLSAHLVAKGADWSVGYVRQCAERMGLVPGALAGRLVLPGAEEGSPPALTLAFDAQAALSDDPQLASVRRLNVLFDVAQTPAQAEAFAAWQHTVRELGTAMAADVVDDNGRPITLHHYAAIHDEVQRLYAALAERDMAAGSAVARRLFQ
jgi:hypothetical protein